MSEEMAKELEARASESYAEAEESFQRCDTDGFVSQWAHGVHARLLQAQAEIERNDGMADFPALFDEERRVDAKLIEGRYGMVWLLSSAEGARYGRKFVPRDTSHWDSGHRYFSRSRVQAKLGLHQEYERAPARAITWAPPGARGLSGATQVQIIIERTDKYGWETG